MFIQCSRNTTQALISLSKKSHLQKFRWIFGNLKIENSGEKNKRRFFAFSSYYLIFSRDAGIGNVLCGPHEQARPYEFLLDPCIPLPHLRLRYSIIGAPAVAETISRLKDPAQYKNRSSHSRQAGTGRARDSNRDRTRLVPLPLRRVQSYRSSVLRCRHLRTVFP